jgi:hypothetical protein
MKSLSHLNLATVPKIFLTATLTPEHEQVLADYVGISLRETLVLRSPTTRPNHLIQVAGLTSKMADVIPVGLRLASLLLEKWEDDPYARGIIFVRSQPTVALVKSSSPFPLSIYHGGLAEQKKDVEFNRWLSPGSPEKWIVATTALLHGVDYPRVDSVIFLESPYGLYDFVQGAGRAGRSGQRSLIVILHRSPLPKPFYTPGQYTCEEGMRKTINGPNCRRGSISKVMDGLSTSCPELADSAFCDVCEGALDPIVLEAIHTSMPAPIPVPAPILVQAPIPMTPLNHAVRHPPPAPPPTSLLSGKMAQIKFRSRGQHAQAAKNLISRFSGCFSCRIVDLEHQPCHSSCGLTGVSSCSETPHIPFSCTTLDHRFGWIQWKKPLRFPTDGRRCSYCGLPEQILVTGEHKTNLPPGTKCRYSDSPITAAWHVLNTSDLLEAVKEELGFVPSSDLPGSFGLWLMGYGSETEDIRLFSLFSWLCKRYYPAAVI